MEGETTIPSKLSPSESAAKAERRNGVHPIFLIMLGAVILLFIVVTVRRF